MKKHFLLRFPISICFLLISVLLNAEPTIPQDMQVFLRKSAEACLSSKESNLTPFFSDTFLMNGNAKKKQVSDVISRAAYIKTLEYHITNLSIIGNIAKIEGYAKHDFGKSPFAEGTMFIKENGKWKWYGNQKGSPSEKVKNSEEITSSPGHERYQKNWTQKSIAGMEVYIYQPETLPKIGEKRALMISLHGCRQKSTYYKERGNWEEVANEYGMIVALPNAPKGGIQYGQRWGCWDFVGKHHTLKTKHHDNVYRLALNFLSDETLNIDKNQVFLTGLSSGGAEAMLMGCMAPDIFTGIGVVAGLLLENCEELAGDKKFHLQNQILSVVQGRKDSTVPIERARQLVRHMKTMYLRFVPGLQKTTISIESLPGYNPRGEGFLWSDHKGARISFIIPENLGHAWPAGYGKGDTKTFIDPESINYPAYVTQFFFDNNRRMKKTP